MTFSLWVLLGLCAGLLTIAAGRVWRVEQPLCALGLFAAGWWYLLFGVISGTGTSELLPQVLGGLFFVSLALLGFRWLLCLSLGWSLHIVWDLLSPWFSDVTYMPGWSVPFCLGFDALLGAYLFLRYRGLFPITVAEGAVAVREQPGR